MIAYGAVQTEEPGKKTLYPEDCEEFFLSCVNNYEKRVIEHDDGSIEIVPSKVDARVGKIEKDIKVIPENSAIIINREIESTINRAYFPTCLRILINDEQRLKDRIISIANSYADWRAYYITDGKYDTHTKLLTILYRCAFDYQYIMKLKGLRNGVFYVNHNIMSKYTDADSASLMLILQYKKLPPVRNGEKYKWIGSPSDAVRFYKAFNMTYTEWNNIFVTESGKPIRDSYCKCEYGYKSGAYYDFLNIKKLLEN